MTYKDVHSPFPSESAPFSRITHRPGTCLSTRLYFASYASLAANACFASARDRRIYTPLFYQPSPHLNMFKFWAMKSSAPNASESSSATSSASSTMSISPPTHPIQIGFTPSGSDALMDICGGHTSSSISSSTCAFPSWPTRSSSLETSHGSRASSYLSDEDLFGDYSKIDCDRVMNEAPNPPRTTDEWLARPLLPLVASGRSKPRRSNKKQVRFDKNMSSIKENAS